MSQPLLAGKLSHRGDRLGLLLYAFRPHGFQWFQPLGSEDFSPNADTAITDSLDNQSSATSLLCVCARVPAYGYEAETYTWCSGILWHVSWHFLPSACQSLTVLRGVTSVKVGNGNKSTSFERGLFLQSFSPQPFFKKLKSRGNGINKDPTAYH